MEATFKLDGCTDLRVGNDLQLPDIFSPRGYILLVSERRPLQLPVSALDPTLPDAVERHLVAAFKPSQARAVASAILACCSEAKGRD
jgi:hypothetical protein